VQDWSCERHRIPGSPVTTTTDHPDRPLLAAQARVLAIPRRYSLLRCISDADGGVMIAELSDRFGLTRTAIRLHLSKLVESRLVSAQAMAPTGPGRPRHRYQATPVAAALWNAGDPFEQLSRLLATQETNRGWPPNAGTEETADRQGDRCDDEPDETFALIGLRLALPPRRAAVRDGSRHPSDTPRDSVSREPMTSRTQSAGEL
jgi:DNA-binding transcriptional ArsR family regulator